MMADVAHIVMKYQGFNPETWQGDVPVTLRHSGSEYPLGRYLRQQLRLQLGRNPQASEKSLQIIAEQMRPLQIAALSNPRGLKGAYQDSTAGKIARVEARSKIFKKGKTL